MKKKLMFLVTCLMLTAACLLGGKPMTAQAATAYQPLDLRHEDVRKKVGTKYFWTTWTDAGKCQLRYSTTSTGSGYLIKSFSNGIRTAEGAASTIVTNGTKVYFTSEGNTLYCYTLSGKTTSSNYTTKALNTTLKSRLDTGKVSSRVAGVNGDRVYISALDLEGYDQSATFCYQGTKLRMILHGHVCAQNSKYLFVNTGNYVMRYDMAEQDMDIFLKYIISTNVVLGGGKIFALVTNQDYEKQYLRAYDPATKSYTTLKTFSDMELAVIPDYYYNGCLYYAQYSTTGTSYYKVKVSDKTVTKLKESTFYSTLEKATAYPYYS